ncbi:zn cluster transcription factor [Lasallia pustulata]|uniref:Zn cluster transcription factor n=1 Tax=Lasallia pustulata TaxID=136370 RepID=A0A1W5CYS2_9LECA|nr:zn cluster transcription factor [Lasallia pustulata]
MDQDGSPQDAGAGGAGTPPTTSGGEGQTSMSPKKRRKERPCTRCIRRKIGHLCHDEPREPVRRPNNEHDTAAGEDEAALKKEGTPPNGMPPSIDQQQADQQLLQDTGLAARNPSTASTARPRESPQLVQPSPVPGGQARTLDNSNNQRYLGYNDWSLGGQNQFQDMHNFHPSYMFNAPEVTNEYNLLNDFLSTSMLDDGAVFAGDDAQSLYSDPALINTMATSANGSNGPYMAPQLQSQFVVPPQAANSQGSSIARPASAMPTDKDRETYYMTAADPSGSDAPEERMNKLLKAKYDAGMLRPFNYVKGYARLDQYMDKHMQPASRQKIRRQLDRFRPKFRERMQTLTDIELVLVEMWFERSLMEYDRVFASMAIPACCWRRTGEIFRGNKEMAELIHVPIEMLRDGKLAIHEIIVEDQLVSYWEKFGAIAFDNSQKAMLTSCSLKNPNLGSKDPEIHCCFSFTIRRDTHNIPSLIVGNFLPMDTSKR